MVQQRQDSEDMITEIDGSSPLGKLKHWQWWLLVIVNICFLLVGQSSGVLLGRFYYDQGGNSKWMATILQSAAFPILIPFLFIPSLSPRSDSDSNSKSPSSNLIVFLIYLSLGVLISADNMLFSIGLLYLSASTYSLICATQLAFSALFAFFLNSQKLTALILNSIVVLSLSASLIALNDDSDKPLGVTRAEYIVSFLTTLSASALNALILSCTQLLFQRVVKTETFFVVLEFQLYTSVAATCVSAAGLFASGEWGTLSGEMESFGEGGQPWWYVLTLGLTAVAWQVSCIGLVGLIFMVSSLFANVIGALSLALTPLAAAAVFGDKMNGVKMVAMLMALWGFATYIYQNYLDDVKPNKSQVDSVDSQISTPLLLENN